MDNTPGKNIGIAQPRSNPPRPNKSVADKASFTFQRTNSVMNNYFTSGSFGAPNSQNRKQRVYNQSPINSFALFSRRQKKEGVKTTSQQILEAQVGQMDRLARIKANAIKTSKPTPVTTVYTTVVTNVSPENATFVNSADGTTASGQYGGGYALIKSIDENINTWTYTQNGGQTNKSTSLHFSTGEIGKKLTGLKIQWKNYNGYNPFLKFGIGNGGTVTSLNMTDASSNGNIPITNTGTVATFVNMTDWHLESLRGKNNQNTTLTDTDITFDPHTIATGDTLYIQVGGPSGGTIPHFQVFEYTFVISEQVPV